jgi:hypothetical protein
MEGHLASWGILAWNENVVSSGSFDRVILRRNIRTHSHMIERRPVGLQHEVSRNVLKCY